MQYGGGGGSPPCEWVTQPSIALLYLYEKDFLPDTILVLMDCCMYKVIRIISI
jgi:hypothetical protein